jgi:hypothetical protein
MYASTDSLARFPSMKEEKPGESKVVFKDEFKICGQNFEFLN